MALPKAHRLKQRQDFSAVYRAGLRRSTVHLTVRALRQQGQSLSKGDRVRSTSALIAKLPTRIGISISQKVSKRAVVRNRIKRLIRASLRQLLPLIDSGWRVVIIVRPEATRCDYQDFLQELKYLLTDARVINGD